MGDERGKVYMEAAPGAWETRGKGFAENSLAKAHRAAGCGLGTFMC